MFCKKCGSEVGNNSFCPKCGAPVAPQGAPQGMPQGAPQGMPQGAPQGMPQGMPQYQQPQYQQPMYQQPRPMGPAPCTIKSKAGISVGMLVAGIYFMLLLGNWGYVPALLIAGYVLIKEEDKWLRKNAVKAIGVAILIDLLGVALDFVPDVIGWISNFVSVCGGSFTYMKFSQIMGIFTGALYIFKIVILVILAFVALAHKSAFGVIDKTVDRNVD